LVAVEAEEEVKCLPSVSAFEGKKSKPIDARKWMARLDADIGGRVTVLFEEKKKFVESPVTNNQCSVKLVFAACFVLSFPALVFVAPGKLKLQYTL